MKIRYIMILTFVVCAIAVVIGLYNKSNYRDFNLEEEPLINFEVGLLSEELVEVQLASMRERLDATQMIVAVKCEEKTHFMFSCTSQKVTVEKVFKGDDIKVGESIEVAKDGGLILLEGYGNGKPSVNMGFVNEMIPGMRYLLFIEKKLDKVDLHIIDSDMIIKPIFCYEEIDNTVQKSLSDEANYTMYVNVKNNEYFFDSENAYNMMNEFKEELKAKYPLD